MVNNPLPSWEERFSVVMLQSLHLTLLTCTNMCQIKKILQHHEKRLVKARLGDLYQKV